MTVTVVVSGVPKHVPLSELARNFDKIFDTDDVGTFRLREISNVYNKRLVGLDFENGFDAMVVQSMLDGFEYMMDDGKEYTLKCKISSDPKYFPVDYTDLASQSRPPKYDYTQSLVTFNAEEAYRQNEKLNAQLILLKKKKMIVEAERELLKAKRKLKREYSKQDSDTDSEDEKRPKRKSTNHEKRVSRWDRLTRHKNSPSPPKLLEMEISPTSSSCERSPSTTRETSTSAAKSHSRSKRSESKDKSSRSRSWRSESRTKRSPSTSSSKRTKHLRSPSQLRKSSSKYTKIYETIESYKFYDRRRSPESRESRVSRLEEEYVEDRRLKLLECSRKSPIHYRESRSNIIQNKLEGIKDLPDPKRRRSVDMWDEVEEVLQDMPMDILEDNGDNYEDKNKTKSITIEFVITCKKKGVPKALEDNKVVSQNDIVQENKPQNTEVGESHCGTDLKKQTDSESSKVENVVNTIDTVKETDKKQTESDTGSVVKSNPKPRFVMPIKKLMNQMKPRLCTLRTVYKDIDNITQTILTERIAEMLKGKDFMKTAQIVTLYRSNYPLENDESFFNEIIENMKKKEK